MALEIEILNLGDLYLDPSFEIKYKNFGESYRCRTVGYLIHGLPEGLLLVDTGYRSAEIMETIGMRASIPAEEGLEAELAKRSIKYSDIRYLLHTHLHIDHVGKDDLFPMSTTVVMNRAELACGAGGIAGWAYPAQDMKHLIDRVYTKDAAWLLDLDHSEPFELFDGLAVELAGGHTSGSLNVLVETRRGLANICGDVFYNVKQQYEKPFNEINHREVRVSGNTLESERAEKAAMKKIINRSDWILPMHDAPALLDKTKKIVGRVNGRKVPGPVI